MARRTRKSKTKRTGRGAKRRLSRPTSKARPRPRKSRPGPARTRTAARKRPAKGVRKRPPRWRKLGVDPQAEVAVLEMNRGRSLTAAARDTHLPAVQLQTYLRQRRLAKRKNRRWVPTDNRLRRVLVLTNSRIRPLTVRGYGEASLAGAHYDAAGQFVSHNDISILKPFEGKSIRAANGRKYPLETDPNALHRIAAMDSPPFHEIYEITSNT